MSFGGQICECFHLASIQSSMRMYHRCNGTSMDEAFYSNRGISPPWVDDFASNDPTNAVQLSRPIEEIYRAPFDSCVESQFQYAAGNSLSLALTHDPRLLLAVRPLNFDRLSDHSLDTYVPLTLADSSAQPNEGEPGPQSPFHRSNQPPSLASSWTSSGRIDSIVETNISLHVDPTIATSANSGYWTAGRLHIEAYLSRCSTDAHLSGFGPSPCSLPFSGRTWPSSRFNETTGLVEYEARALWLGPSRVISIVADEMGYEPPPYKADLNLSLLLGLLIPAVVLVGLGGWVMWQQNNIRRIEERRATTDTTKLTPEEKEALGSLAGLEEEHLAASKHQGVAISASSGTSLKRRVGKS